MIVKHVPLSDIEKPDIDARTKIDEDKQRELVDSIRANGLLEPIALRPKGEDKYEVVFGTRRFLACYELGMGKIPAIIKHYTDEEVDIARLEENIIREDMNQVDIGRYIEKLMNKYHINQSEVARRIGRTEGYVTQMLNLLRRDPFIRDLVETGKIQYTTGRELLKIPVEETRHRLARYARDSGASSSMVKIWADRELYEHDKRAMEFKPPEQVEEQKPYVAPIVTHPCIGCGRIGNIEAMVIFRFCPQCAGDLDKAIEGGAFKREPERPTQQDFTGEPEPESDETPDNGNSEADSNTPGGERGTDTLQGVEE